MEQLWHFKPHDERLVQLIEKQSKVSSLVARLLASRNMTDPQAARDFLDAPLKNLQDPAELSGANHAAREIHAAIRNQKKIVVHGDYDADGMTAAAIMVRCIKMLGGQVSYHVPNRLEEGYGLNEDSLRDLIQRGAALIISVDCGIASVREAALIKSLGAELIITDHHQYGSELPQALAIVHPSLPADVYSHAPLCGAGVAFKVAWALCKQASGTDKVTAEHRDFLMSALALAAIGTVTDVVPLVGENRIIVRHGLHSLKKHPLPGLKQLMSLTGLNDKPALCSEDIAFMIGPRLNAAGRLGQAQLGVELLVSDSAERTEALAEYIENLNRSRDKIERSVYLAAAKQIKEMYSPETDPALVLDGRAWHAGVIGIVAGKIAEKYHTPTIMISRAEMGNAPAIGSARSVGLIDLHAALEHCSDYLLRHGGHAAAAGLQVDESQIDAFREAFLEYVASESNVTERSAKVSVDVEAIFSQLTLKAINEIEQLAPFGQANPRPIFCSTNVMLAAPPKKIGGGERHLAIQFTQHGKRIRGVAFGKAEWADALTSLDDRIDVAYRPVINEFRGRRSVEIQLVDWRPSRDTIATQCR